MEQEFEDDVDENDHEASVNGTGRTRRESIVETSVLGSVVDFHFINGETVSIDVSKLPDAVKLAAMVDGVRTSGRLSYQKVDDPAKAAQVLREKFARLMKGELTQGRAARKQPTDLTQAIANITGRSVQDVESNFYHNYFMNTEESGCTLATVGGKTRIYGKQAALERLRGRVNIKPELEKVMKERERKEGSDPKKPLDMARLAAG